MSGIAAMPNSGIRSSDNGLLIDPEGFAMDWDGVISDHKNPDRAQTLRPLLLQRSLGNQRPLAVITGKEEKDAWEEIIQPSRADIERLGIKLNPQDFLVFTNNGSNLIDVVSGEVLERREFSTTDLANILNIETVKALLEIYKRLDQIYAQIPTELRESHLRQRDMSTICFRIDEKDLSHPQLPLDLRQRITQLTGGKKNPTRIDLAEGIQKELAAIGLGNVVVSATDRSVDVTPSGTGKRPALQRFSIMKNIPIDRILRVDDSYAGMGFGLTAPNWTAGEVQSGFTNVAIDLALIHRVRLSAQWSGFGIPREIPAPTGLDQFGKVEWLLTQIENRQQVSRSTLAA